MTDNLDVMTTTNWKEHFKAQLGDLEQSYPSTEGPSLLYHVLNRQIISVDDYLQWAQETFQLPLLKLAYFSENPTNQKVWQQWKGSYAWTPECLPLRQWEDVLYVACLEPQHFPESIKAICVLTPPAGLQQLWSGYQSADLFELKDNETSNDEAFSPAETSEEENLDLNFDAAPKSDVLVSLDLKEDSLEALSSPSDEANSEQMPEGMNFGKVEKTNLFADLTALKNASSVKIEKPEVAVLEEKPAEIPKEPTPAEAVTQIKATPIVRPLSATDLAKGDTTKEGKFFLAEAFKKASAQWTNEAGLIFSQMKTHFEKSLIFAVDEEGNQARAISWSDGFKPSNESSVDLHRASIFRIASSTQKPFHGPISLNDVNEKFFNDWNNGFTPLHATIVPIMHESKLIGLLLGFGEASAYNRQVLQFTEKIAKEFSQKFSQAKAA